MRSALVVGVSGVVGGVGSLSGELAKPSPRGEWRLAEALVRGEWRLGACDDAVCDVNGVIASAVST